MKSRDLIRFAFNRVSMKSRNIFYWLTHTAYVGGRFNPTEVEQRALLGIRISRAKALNRLP